VRLTWRLSRLAVAVWVLWLGLFGLLAAMVLGRVGHPHFLPVTALLAALAGAWVLLAAGAVWRLIRGPGRAHALACLLLGTAPVLAFTGHALYGLRGGYGRSFDVNYPVILLIPLGESVMDLEARVRYPLRTPGEKVVMISGPLDAASARAQVAAMDRHVRALEARLGRTMPGRVHWVRGPLLGMERRALFALCLGSKPGEHSAVADGLAMLDRHEVAHCVIGLMGPTDRAPPALLLEGWAESNGGLGEAELEARAVDLRERGDSLSVRELTGPEWYGRHQWPVYCQGAPLVNLLLKTYGPDRFFKFYTTCRPATVADDCRRALGADLDRLDAEFQAALDRRVGPRGLLGSRLAGLRTGLKVDPAAWLAFLDEYLPAASRLVAPYEHVRMTAEQTYVGTDDRGKPSRYLHRYVFKRTPPFASLAHSSGPGEKTSLLIPTQEDVLLATPARSFRAERQGPGRPWEVEIEARVQPDRAYRRTLHSIEEREPAHLSAASLLAVAQMIGSLVDTSTFEVTALERFVEDDRPQVRVRIEDLRKPLPSFFRAFTAVLAVDDLFADRSAEYEDREGMKGQTDYLYDRHDGVPVLRSSRARSARRDGQSTSNEFKVIERQFGPVPAAEFAADRLINGPTVLKASDPYADDAWQARLSNGYWVPLAASAFCLLGGTFAGGRLRSRRRQDFIDDSPATR